MRKKLLLYLIVLFSALGMIVGCGGGGGGSSSSSSPTTPADSPFVSETSCKTCHTYAHNQDLATFSVMAGELKGVAETTAAFAKHSCQDCHGGGQLHQGIGPMPFPKPDLARCISCHNDEVGKYLASKHNAGQNLANLSMSSSGYYPADRGGYCADCHTSEGFAKTYLGLNVETTSAAVAPAHMVGCASCHNPIKGEQRTFDVAGVTPSVAADANGYPEKQESCIKCHSTISSNHVKSNPFSQEISERFLVSRHSMARARTGDCAACHSHEGGVAFLKATETGGRAVMSAAGYTELAGTGIFASAQENGISKKACTTCHEPHGTSLRGLGDVTQTVAATATGPAERVVYSAEFNLCTTCHQVNLEANWNPSAGYSSGGMFEYTLKNSTDPTDFQYHSSNSRTDYYKRVIYDSHFAGKLSREVAEGIFGSDVDSPDVLTQFNITVDTDGNYVVKGYGINPGSKNACSACHDVHSASKFGADDNLVVPDGAVGVGLQTAIRFGQGIGKAHGNYVVDPFSRENSSIGCMPCHTGRDFVHMTKGVAAADLTPARWNPLGCTSCHDMLSVQGYTESGGFSGNVRATTDTQEPRTFLDTHKFSFAKGDFTLDTADLGNNQVCFECHKGRTGYNDDPTVTTVYGINYLHYSPTFAIRYGVEGMVPKYDGKDYTRDWSGHYHQTSNRAMDCVGCHDIHTEYNRVGFTPQNLKTNLCSSCHYVTDVTQSNYWRSFNVLQKRTQVFGDVLFESIIDELRQHVSTNNDAAIIIQGLNGTNVNSSTDKVAFTNLIEDEPKYAGYATAVSDSAIKKRLKTYITGSTRDVTGSRLVNNELAKAGAVWKNFTYDDKGGWAHNSILARQMMYDAIQDLGGDTALCKLQDAVAAPVQDGAIGVRIGDGTQNGDLMRNLSAGSTVRVIPATCP